MTDVDIERLVEPIFVSTLEVSGLERVSVRSGDDHDGNPALFIEVFFEGRGRSVDHRALMFAIERARSTIRESGETRFPYLQLHIPDPDESLAA